MRRCWLANLLVSLAIFAVPALPALAQRGKSVEVKPRVGVLANQTVYTNSYAVIIGIDYETFPKELQLENALNDGDDLKNLLVASYGFPAENITLLKGKNATRRNIEKALASLTRKTILPTDRVLVYFSGHGQTIKTNEGGDMGFLIPADAEIDLRNPNDSEPYFTSCLAMDSVWRFLEASPAKHRLLIADACFGGLLIQGKGFPGERPNGDTLRGFLAIPALQAIAAGGKGDEAFILPNLRNSVFTHKLLESLRQAAVTPGEVVTTSELGASLKTSVANLIAVRSNGRVKQTPQFGSRGTEGEFLFISAGTGGAPSPVSVAADPEATGGKASVVNTRARLKVTTNVPAAVVTVEGKAITNGEFSLNLLDEPTKSVQVKVTASGYEGQIVNATLERGKLLPLTVTLESIKVSTPSVAATVPPPTKTKLTAVLLNTTTVGSQTLALALSPDRKRIIAGSGNDVARIRDTATGAALLTLPQSTRNTTAVAFSYSGKRVATSGGSGYTVRIWDATTGKQVFPLVGHTGYVASIAFSPDGKRIVSGSEDDTARVWDATTGKLLRILKGHSRNVSFVAFSPDSKRIATGSIDNTAKVWDAVSGTEQLTLLGHGRYVNCIAFSPDGKRIVSGGSDRKMRIWNATTGEEILKSPQDRTDVSSVVFSPDGNWVFVGYYNSPPKIWDANTGKELIEFPYPQRAEFINVTMAAFSADRGQIVVGEGNGSVRVWELR